MASRAAVDTAEGATAEPSAADMEAMAAVLEAAMGAAAEVKGTRAAGTAEVVARVGVGTAAVPTAAAVAEAVAARAGAATEASKSCQPTGWSERMYAPRVSPGQRAALQWHPPCWQ